MQPTQSFRIARPEQSQPSETPQSPSDTRKPDKNIKATPVTWYLLVILVIATFYYKYL